MVCRVIRCGLAAVVFTSVVLAVSLLAQAPAAAQPLSRVEASILDGLEVRFKLELERARADQRENQTTLTAGQALLEKARAAKDQAAVSAAQRAGSDGLGAEPSKANVQYMHRWWEEWP